MKEKEIDQQKQRKTKLAVGNITPLNTPYNWVSAPYLGSYFLKRQIFFLTTFPEFSNLCPLSVSLNSQQQLCQNQENIQFLGFNYYFCCRATKSQAKKQKVAKKDRGEEDGDPYDFDGDDGEQETGGKLS